MGNWYDSFQQGQGNNLGQAYEQMGNNPQTYGYLYGKVADAAKMAQANNQAAKPADINVNYQQPEDQYAKLYRRYGGY